MYVCGVCLHEFVCDVCMYVCDVCVRMCVCVCIYV